jgi:hypothetical protein
MVVRQLEDGEVQFFDVFGSSVTRCHHNAMDLERALNESVEQNTEKEPSKKSSS